MTRPESQTCSHTLAKADILSFQDAEPSHDGSVVDLGWNQKPEHDAKPWVKGMHNEDVWVLVRRMNKQVYELRKTDTIPYGGLDLVVARDSECSPNKLRSETERLYMGLLLGLFAFTKSLARLRSWREPARTAAFCLTYFAAWILDCLIMVLIGTVMILVVSPRVRAVLFPPAPLSMVDTRTGGLAKPMAGTLGSTDAATGAPQNLKGESVENEASNFITSVAAVATNLMMGQDPHGAPSEQEGGGQEGFTPQFNVTTMAVVKDKAEGMDRPSQDKTKAPIEEVVWNQMKPLLHLIILTSDTWERLAKWVHPFPSVILVPTPPFDRPDHRIRLACYVAPLAVLSLFLTRDVAVRGFTFGVGILLFGDPFTSRIYRAMTSYEWAQYFHLNKGVPTNSQLALTLLRLGEAHHAPFPPPARVDHAPPDEPIDMDETVISASGGDLPLGASDNELQDAADRDEDMADHAGGEDTEVKQAVGHGTKREKVFSILKGGAKEAVRATAVLDKLRAKAGSAHAKQRIGVVPSRRGGGNGPLTVGPVEFSARCEGRAGFVYVNAAADEPFLAFNERSIQTPATKEDLRTLWVLNVDDITQLRKHSGYGMKAKLAAGWATDGPIYDSLRIVGRDGKNYVVTALPYRDALFNRLCAIGKHAKWEVW
ncbi:hypothetical protein ACHAQA_002570 [Verticillium albo-atrum]